LDLESALVVGFHVVRSLGGTPRARKGASIVRGDLVVVDMVSTAYDPLAFFCIRRSLSQNCKDNSYAEIRFGNFEVVTVACHIALYDEWNDLGVRRVTFEC
jgi:hypothetical protein